MQVDVVIPAYNAARWLPEAIRSALGQTRPPTRVIVVDDGSEDETSAVLRTFRGEVVSLHHAKNRGLPAARNTGILAGSSELLAFLDADDVWAREKLEKQLPEFDGPDPPGLSYTSLFDCDAELRPLGPPRPFQRRVRRDVFCELYLQAFPIPPSTVIVRRRVFDACGLFDESMLKAQDLEFWLRVAMRFTVSCLPEPLCYRRANAQSITMAAGFERHTHFALRAFELCAQAAAAAGVPLPADTEERKATFLRRSLREALRRGDREAARFFVGKLMSAGRYRRRDRMVCAALRARTRLCRPLQQLSRRPRP